MADPESGRLLQLMSSREMKELLKIYTELLLGSQIMTFLVTFLFNFLLT